MGMELVEEGFSACCDLDVVQQVVPTLTPLQHTPTSHHWTHTHTRARMHACIHTHLKK